MKLLVGFFIVGLLFPEGLTAQKYADGPNCRYYPLPIDTTWQYERAQAPQLRNEMIIDTARIHDQLYYAFAPYGENNNLPVFWLRPTFRKMYLLNPQDSTEDVLFDFEADINQSWEIPASESPPYNQCYWGETVTLVSRSDTVVNKIRTFYWCYHFRHSTLSCYDAGLTDTYFVRDVGKVRFSENTEGGVLDWDLQTPKVDTSVVTGTLDVEGNPCLTDPCLPGIVYIIVSNEGDYVLSDNGQWFDDTFIWDGCDYTFDFGDSAIAVGVITERRDINWETYHTIDLVDFETISTTALASQTNNDPESYRFIRNFPNPFNNTTVIRFWVPANDRVTLKIYDVVGSQITALIDEYKRKGMYQTRFNAGHLASGVYYCRLTVGRRIETHKIIVLN